MLVVREDQAQRLFDPFLRDVQCPGPVPLVFDRREVLVVAGRRRVLNCLRTERPSQL